MCFALRAVRMMFNFLGLRDQHSNMEAGVVEQLNDAKFSLMNIE